MNFVESFALVCAGPYYYYYYLPFMVAYPALYKYPPRGLLQFLYLAEFKGTFLFCWCSVSFFRLFGIDFPGPVFDEAIICSALLEECLSLLARSLILSLF